MGNPRWKDGPMRSATMVFLVLAFAPCCSAALAATQAVELAIRTDRPEAVYAKGETATFIIEMKNGGPLVAQAPLEVELSSNGFWDVERREVVLEEGRAQVSATQAKPSVLWVRATYRPEGGEAVKALGGAAFSPEEIQASMPPPDDFDEFWSAQKALVDAAPLNAVLTPVPCPVEGYEIFAVTMDGLDGTKVTGYLAKPEGEGPFPGLLRFQWSGVYSLDPNWALNYARWGFLAFNMNPHDIENGQPERYYEELRRGRLAAYSHQGRESRETSYLRQMFLRCYRAAEFVASRPDWDGHNLVATGSSMGGGQALAAAALSPHVTAIAVDAPAMCDHTAAVVGRMPGWPKLVAMRAGVPDPVQLEASRYVDGVNLASRITVPALVGTGFQDLTCPSSSVFAVCNSLRGPKQLVLDPLSGHSGEKPNWSRESREFLLGQQGR
jgi:cephalosporin-C deacetylase